MSDFTFAMSRDELAHGIPEIASKASEVTALVQRLGVAACQYTVTDAKAVHLTELLEALPTRWRKAFTDWTVDFCPIRWNVKDAKFAFAHDKAWAMLAKAALVPADTLQKGEVPAALLAKLLVFMTGALTAVKWAEYQPKREKVEKPVDLEQLQKQAAKLLAKATTIGRSVVDLFPDADLTKHTLATSAATVSAPALKYTDLLSALDDALECTSDEHRQVLLDGINRLIKSALENTAVRSAA